MILKPSRARDILLYEKTPSNDLCAESFRLNLRNVLSLKSILLVEVICTRRTRGNQGGRYKELK